MPGFCKVRLLTLAEDQAGNMTHRRIWFPLVPAVVAAIFAGSGCGTATIEDAVPVSATASTVVQPEATGASEADVGPGRAIAADEPATFERPGDYPNLNVIPKPAAEHITAEEKAAEAAQLRAKRDRQLSQGRGSGSSDAERLRRLANSHAEETLKAIEAE